MTKETLHMTKETLQKGEELLIKLNNAQRKLSRLEEGNYLYVQGLCNSKEQLSDEAVTPAIRGLIIENFKKTVDALEKEFNELN